VTWDFNDSSVNESNLRPLCEQVDNYFQMPNAKLYRYFATSDDKYFNREIGPYYRGFHFHRSSAGDIPDYTIDRYLPPDPPTFEHLIYIRNTTCLDNTGCVVTYAHEMQHIRQHENFPKLAEATFVLRDNLAIFEPTATEIDIPAEVDANLVSKQIAERVCSVEAVKRFAEEQVRLMKKAGETAHQIRWEYFLNTASSTPYDFVDETVKLVKKYEKRMNFGIVVSAPHWWKGPHAKSSVAGSS
jgi:hypothetical protein